MESGKSASRETLEESVESSTPYVPEDIPDIGQVETPTPVGTLKPDRSNIKMKLSSFASPFKSKSFHLGSVKRSKLSDSKDDSDKEAKESKRWKKKKKKTEEVTTDEELGLDAETEGISGEEEMLKGKRKKKSGARSKAGAFVRKLGSLGSGRGARESPEPGGGGEKHSSGSSSLTPASVKRRTPDGRGGPSSEQSIDDDDSRRGSVENLVATRADMFSPINPPGTDEEQKETTNNNKTEQLVEENRFPETIKEEATSESVDRDVSDSDSLPIKDPLGSAIATTHPVSTLPFAKSTWKRNKTTSVQVIPRPIESPSPEDALRRRIAFVAQASVCLSEDKEDWDPAAAEHSSPRLSRMVQLAQQRRRSSAQSADRSPEPSQAATPDPEAGQETSQDADRTDDEEFLDTEEARLLPEHGMPPFGDFIDGSEAKRDMGSGSSSHPAQAGPERREHLYKILVIGELGTGKTSIIKRYVHQFYSQHYRATIGVDFALKVLNWDSNTTIRLQLWDIAGQERFGNMTRVYYKEAVGAFVVFDVTRVATFEAVLKWKQDLDSKVQLPDGSPIPCVLLANKCDQQKEGIANFPMKMDEYCKEKGFAGWFETSAKENINIEDAARSLVNKILVNDKLLQSSEIRDGDSFALEGQNGGAEAPAKRKICGC